MGVRPRPWGHGQGGRGDAAKALKVRPRRPWGHGQGTGVAAKAAVGARQKGSGDAAKAQGARLRRPWGAAKALGARPRQPWSKAKVLEASPRRPLWCGQGPGGSGKAAVEMQPRP